MFFCSVTVPPGGGGIAPIDSVTKASDAQFGVDAPTVAVRHWLPCACAEPQKSRAKSVTIQNFIIARRKVAVLTLHVMRDMVTDFYIGTLRKLIEDGDVSISDSVLVVCGGQLDRDVTNAAGFGDVTVTNIDGNAAHQDAESLSYPDASFDVVIVHAGLHHCYSPHRALLEMYRVARKMVVAFESRDSLLMNLAVRFGLTVEYEVDSVTADGKGGVAESGIPNFIYRWTERDVRSAIASFDPIREPSIRYFYDLRIPLQRYIRSGNIKLRLIGRFLAALSLIFRWIIPKQGNEFAFAISKNGVLHPWIIASP